MRKILLITVVMAITSQANAASRVWIAEFSILGSVNPSGQAQIAHLPPLATQTVDISGGVQSATATSSQTRYVRIICEVQCAIKVGGTAANTDTLMPSLQPEYFAVNPSAVISIIAAP